MQHRRRALLAATLLCAACGGAAVAATDIADGGAADDVVADGGDASTDVVLDGGRARDVATDIPLLDEKPCREAGTLFQCLDCCDFLYPPGQQIYLEQMDRCGCESCPDCAGSDQCIWDAGARSPSSQCIACVDKTREHEGPTSCHPSAQQACDEYAGCIASQRCMIRSQCFDKPVQ